MAAIYRTPSPYFHLIAYPQLLYLPQSHNLQLFCERHFEFLVTCYAPELQNIHKMPPPEYFSLSEAQSHVPHPVSSHLCDLTFQPRGRPSIPSATSTHSSKAPQNRGNCECRSRAVTPIILSVQNLARACANLVLIDLIMIRDT